MNYRLKDQWVIDSQRVKTLYFRLSRQKLEFLSSVSLDEKWVRFEMSDTKIKNFHFFVLF